MAGHEPAAQIDRLRARYWLRTCLLTAALLMLWFGMTFASGYFADTLNAYDFLGFPLGFYLSAQGNLIGYLAIILVYAKIMNRMDREQAIAEDRLAGPDARATDA